MQRITLFISYSKDDLHWLELMANHLSPLRRDGLIEIWDDRQLPASSERQWEESLLEELNTAGVIVILYSPSFAQTDYCQKELQIALNRKSKGLARVFIVRVRPCELQQEVAAYQIRPTKGRSISTEPNHDAALSEIAAEIRETLQSTPGSRRPPDLAQQRSRANDSGGLTQQSVQQDVPSIAVLPFRNVGNDKETEYFSDGLAEDIINGLTHLTGLKVTARASAFKFRDKEEDISEIQRRLRVNHMLTGSVRQLGQRVRITVTLINVADGFHLWSERYDREISDIFAVQDEIAESVATKLRVRFSSMELVPSRRRHSENMDAYNAYLKGRYLWNKLTPEGLAKAKEHYETALALDPDYALVHCALAEYYFSFPTAGLGPAREFFPQARLSAERALELDDTLSDARAMLGAIKAMFDYDWKGAEEEFLRARNATPGLADVHVLFGRWFLLPQGKYREALEAIEKGQIIDPLVPLFAQWAAEVQFCENRLDLALKTCQEALELDANYWLSHLFIGWSNIYLGKLTEALGAFESAKRSASGSVAPEVGIAICLALDGKKEEAQEIFVRLGAASRESYIPPTYLAQLAHFMGDLDGMFNLLDQAVEARDPMLFWCICPSQLNYLRTDPRYQSLLRRVNLE